MKNKNEQKDDTKIPKKAVQKLENFERVLKAENEEEGLLNAHKIEQTSKNQLR